MLLRGRLRVVVTFMSRFDSRRRMETEDGGMGRVLCGGSGIGIGMAGAATAVPFGWTDGWTEGEGSDSGTRGRSVGVVCSVVGERCRGNSKRWSHL